MRKRLPLAIFLFENHLKRTTFPNVFQAPVLIGAPNKYENRSRDVQETQHGDEKCDDSDNG
jgi:hypothetical protein